jgi:hypothetical protein
VWQSAVGGRPSTSPRCAQPSSDSPVLYDAKILVHPVVRSVRLNCSSSRCGPRCGCVVRTEINRRRHRGSSSIARVCVAAAHIFRTNISEESLTILTVFVLSVSEVDGLAW